MNFRYSYIPLVLKTENKERLSRLQKATQEAAACDGIRPQVVILCPFWMTLVLHFSWELRVKKIKRKI